MAIKFPQHDLPPDLLNSRVSGAMATCGDEFGTLLFGDFFQAEPAPEVANAMAATESGADAFAGAGDVVVRGSLSVSETGIDAASLSGDVFVVGAMSASEISADVATMSGDVTVQGDLAATEHGEDVATASLQVVVFGSMDVTEEGQDVFLAASPKAKPKKKSGSWVSIPRESGKKPIEVVYDMRTKEEIAKAAQPKTTPAPVQAEAPAHVVAKLKPVQRVDLTPIIDAATSAYSEAIGEYVQGAKEQLAHAAAVQAAKDARARAIADELMRVAIKKARDEDEAAALVVIMAALEE